MHTSNVVSVATLLSLLIGGTALAEDYLPLISPETGQEYGRAYRTDGTPPTKARADADKKACFLDPREISGDVVDRITKLAKTDRTAATIASVKAVIPCMSKKGWRTVIASTQSSLVWDYDGSNVALGTKDGDDLVMKLDCFERGEFYLWIFVSDARASGPAKIYLNNPDAGSRALEIEGELSPEDKEWSQPPLFSGQVPASSFLPYFEKGSQVHISGAVNTSIPVQGLQGAANKLLEECPLELEKPMPSR